VVSSLGNEKPVYGGSLIENLVQSHAAAVTMGILVHYAIEIGCTVGDGANWDCIEVPDKARADLLATRWAQLTS